eukprot:scaffold309914_cov17-Prasinocladus_malaysianus.AAC.1
MALCSRYLKYVVSLAAYLALELYEYGTVEREERVVVEQNNVSTSTSISTTVLVLCLLNATTRAPTYGIATVRNYSYEYERGSKIKINTGGNTVAAIWGYLAQYGT